MSLSRRIFLRTGTLSALAAGCALSPGVKSFARDPFRPSPAADAEIPYEATLNPVFHYTRETFEPYVGGLFRGSSSYLKLLRVSGYSPASGTRLTTERALPTDSFTLTFQAGRSLLERNSVYLLEHAALGKFSLFMTRYVDLRGQIFYEAVINHVV